jgi:hypothetical protein
VPWLRRLAPGLTQQGSGFDPGSGHVTFVVDSVALTLGVFRTYLISPVFIIPPIPPMLHTHPATYMLLLPEGQDRALGTFQKHCCFGNCGALDRKLLSYFKGLISSEGKTAVSVCREQMASSFGLALPCVEPNPSLSTFTCNSFTAPSVGAALRRVMQRVELL